MIVRSIELGEHEEGALNDRLISQVVLYFKGEVGQDLSLLDRYDRTSVWKIVTNSVFRAFLRKVRHSNYLFLVTPIWSRRLAVLIIGSPLSYSQQHILPLSDLSQSQPILCL